MSHCPACGSENPAENQRCDQCGSVVGAPGPTASTVGFTVGRDEHLDPGRDLVIPEYQVQVSRRHARVSQSGDRWFIEDLGSANGTFVNERRIVGPTPFQPTDRVRLGTYVLNTADLLSKASGGSGRFGASGADLLGSLPPPPATPPQRQGGAMPPAGPQGYGVQGQAPGTIRNPGLVILFSILTLGIYGFYWWWVTLDDVKRWRGGQGWSGAMCLLMLVPCVGIAFLAALFLLPSYVEDLYVRDGRPAPCSALLGLWILLPFIGGIVWWVIVQGALNDYWRSKGAVG